MANPRVASLISVAAIVLCTVTAAAQSTSGPGAIPHLSHIFAEPPRSSRSPAVSPQQRSSSIQCQQKGMPAGIFAIANLHPSSLFDRR
jgi:hypothetical protein